MKQFLMLGNETSQVILSLSLMLFAGFLVTRVTKRLKLPNVTGYIFAGILLGPYLLDAVPVEVASGMGFVTDIALAYIAFGVGRYFKIATLKKSGGGTLIITVLEALLAFTEANFTVKKRDLSVALDYQIESPRLTVEAACSISVAQLLSILWPILKEAIRGLWKRKKTGPSQRTTKQCAAAMAAQGKEETHGKESSCQ